jgi:hypothetical protein
MWILSFFFLIVLPDNQLKDISILNANTPFLHNRTRVQAAVHEHEPNTRLGISIYGILLVWAKVAATLEVDVLGFPSAISFRNLNFVTNVAGSLTRPHNFSIKNDHAEGYKDLRDLLAMFSVPALNCVFKRQLCPVACAKPHLRA